MDTEYWLWLNQLKGIGPITQKKLLEHFKTPKRIYASSAVELASVSGMGATLAHSIGAARSLDGAFCVLEQMHQQKMKVLVYDDPLYPDLAKEWPEAPTVLFYRGEIRANGIGIVGSRRCTAYGKRIAIEAADYLAHRDIPVISGLAKGIDGYAHTACLRAGGYTIAFLGNGLDLCYPKEHLALQAAIIENGAVISQYLPGTKPRPEHFPQRNALISCFCQKLLVVEAAEKSGALSTAQFAKVLNREILVPPHEIYVDSGRGTNRLLKNGATLYLSPEQLLPPELVKKAGPDETAMPPVGEQQAQATPAAGKAALTVADLKIQSALAEAAQSLQELEAHTGIKQVQLLERLSMLELEGLVTISASGVYRWCG
jgi:DNA processing protein